MRALVVGYGFAGASISHFLRLHDVDVSVVNHADFDVRSSTNVSAGIIVPLSGRRKVPVFSAEKTVSFAWNHYLEIQRLTSLNIVSEKKIIEIIHDFREYNDWYGKSSDKNIGDWFSIEKMEINPFINSNGNGFILYNNAGCISPTNLLNAYRHLNNTIEFHDLQFNYQFLDISNGLVRFGNDKYDLVVFAEGHRCVNNPYWSYLPFMPVKGEIMDFHAPELGLDYIINGDLYVIPIGDGFYRAGATYSWSNIDEVPSSEGLGQLKEKLEKLIRCDYEIVKHQAAVRPAIKDRRPVIGRHPDFDNIWIFNGLGTKGALYSPYYGKQLSDAIVGGEPLDMEVDVKRFTS
jgi:glycine/D-amino acid oxidase-like deaminating enzyme